MIYTLPEDDLGHILRYCTALWKELKHERIFISGGTGFFGSWLLESFLFANKILGLNSGATILTRDPKAYQERFPNIAGNPSVRLIKGDIRNFAFPPGNYSFIVHAANETLGQIKNPDPEKEQFDIITKGTEHILDFASKCGCKKLLFTSSGAVYGRQPLNVLHIPEDFTPKDESDLTSYGKCKIIAENMCCSEAITHEFEVKIARCFCFIGPYLQLTAQLAAGNFIKNALVGEPIIINGDGTPLRSYLYASDLAIWLWTILLNGANCRPYNVGSEEVVSIFDLAKAIAKSADKDLAIQIRGYSTPHTAPERYVPETERARNELGLLQRVTFTEAIEKSLRWFSKAGI
ncbi:MAG: NAD(P)-dependent oxidoreductase [SAR324 cluster bacterium]|uniref:NAD(P)-dependent oxidoreductase n=1 Tax=SAR324 cluster bacterium TaxID=2024889 RepID=A0A7X9FR34_9DELT|nr:NAD(P)-dependent oxidoreductase [SAR324 cluster bacterium]